MNIYNLPNPKYNHYFNRYIKLINNYINYKFNGYTETHHILPKSMSGTNDKSNLIVLSARLHYIAHYLLWKAYDSNSTLNAFLMMHNSNEHHSRYSNSKFYSEARIAHSLNMSNLLKGKTRVKNNNGETILVDSDNIPPDMKPVMSSDEIRKNIKLGTLRYYESIGKVKLFYNTLTKEFFHRNLKLLLLEENLIKLPENIIEVFSIKRGESYKYVYDIETGKRKICNLLVDKEPQGYSFLNIKNLYTGKNYILSDDERARRSARISGENNPTKRNDVRNKLRKPKTNIINYSCPHCGKYFNGGNLFLHMRSNGFSKFEINNMKTHLSIQSTT